MSMVVFLFNAAAAAVWFASGDVFTGALFSVAALVWLAVAVTE